MIAPWGFPLIGLVCLSLPKYIDSFVIQSDANACDVLCPTEASMLWKYKAGMVYTYNYSVDATTSMIGISNQKSTVGFTSKIYVEPISPCQFLLNFGDVKLEDNVDDESQIAALEDSSVKFTFVNGQIREVCVDTNDDSSIINIKKGAISMFQQRMEQFGAYEKVKEIDVIGECMTEYIPSGSSWGGQKTFHKRKDENSCTHRQKFRQHTLNLPNFQQLPLIKSDHECQVSVNDGIVWKNTCEEKHQFQPFSSSDSVATTTVRQQLAFMEELPGHLEQKGIPNRPTTLLYDYRKKEIDTKKDETNAIRILKTLSNTPEDSRPEVFGDLMQSLRPLSYADLVMLFYEFRTDKIAETFLVDALPLLRTDGAISLIKDIIKSDNIKPETIDRWFSSFMSYSEPTRYMISVLTDFIDETARPSALMGISSMITTYCRNNPDCSSIPEIKEIMTRFSHNLGSKCFAVGQDEEKSIILSLRAIKNIGSIDQSTMFILETCHSEFTNSIFIRLAALEAMKSVNCQERLEFNNYLFQSYQNVTNDSELRIGAYRSLISCPSPEIIDSIKRTLIDEPVNQVGSYVWTHLTNIQESQSLSPHKRALKQLVGSKFLQNKWNTDARKFSRYFESSYYSNEYKVGGTAEGSLIFSQESYIPRSLNLNLTANVFGQNVHFMEMGGRAEGFEALVEDMFGPDGYFKEDVVHTFFQSLRNRREVGNEISNLQASYNTRMPSDEPKGNFFLKMFGRDYVYGSFNGVTNLFNEMYRLLPFNDPNDIEYSHSSVFLDADMLIPTGAGLPLFLAVNGTSTINLTSKTDFNIKELWTKGSASVAAHIYPSTTVQVVGTMSLHLNSVQKTGLKTISKLHSSSYVDVQIQIDNKRLIKAAINVPKEKTDILSVSVDFLSFESGQFVPLKSKNPKHEVTYCTPQLFSHIFGLQMCGESQYHYKNESAKGPSYLAAAGPFKFDIIISKTDDFDQYLFNYKWDTHGSKNVVELNFDTPRSNVDRRSLLQVSLDEQSGSLDLAVPIRHIRATAQYKRRDDIIIAEGSFSMDKANVIAVSHKFQYRENEILSTTSVDIEDKQLIHYHGSYKYGSEQRSLDLALKGSVHSDIMISGSLTKTETGHNGALMIDSSPLTLNIDGQMTITENGFKTKGESTYRIYGSEVYSMSVYGFYETSSTGQLMKHSSIISLKSTQFSHLNSEVSWIFQSSSNYLENSLKLVVGSERYTFRQIYSSQVGDVEELLFALGFAHPSSNTEYKIDLGHHVSKIQNTNKLTLSLGRTFRFNIFSNLQKQQNPLDYGYNCGLEFPGHKYGLGFDIHHQKQNQLTGQAHVQWKLDEKAEVVFHIEQRQNIDYLIKASIDIPRYKTISIDGNLSSNSTISVANLNFQHDDSYYTSRILYESKPTSRILSVLVDFDRLSYSGTLKIAKESELQTLQIDVHYTKHIQLIAQINEKSLFQETSVDLYWDKNNDDSQHSRLVSKFSSSELAAEFSVLNYSGRLIGILGPRKLTTEIGWGNHWASLDMSYTKKPDLLQGVVTGRSSWKCLETFAVSFNHDFVDSINWTSQALVEWNKEEHIVKARGKRVDQDIEGDFVVTSSSAHWNNTIGQIHLSYKSSIDVSLHVTLRENSYRMKFTHGKDDGRLSVEGLNNIGEVSYAFGDKKSLLVVLQQNTHTIVRMSIFAEDRSNFGFNLIHPYGKEIRGSFKYSWELLIKELNLDVKYGPYSLTNSIGYSTISGVNVHWNLETGNDKTIFKMMNFVNNTGTNCTVSSSIDLYEDNLWFLEYKKRLVIEDEKHYTDTAMLNIKQHGCYSLTKLYMQYHDIMDESGRRTAYEANTKTKDTMYLKLSKEKVFDGEIKYVADVSIHEMNTTISVVHDPLRSKTINVQTSLGSGEASLNTKDNFVKIDVAMMDTVFYFNGKHDNGFSATGKVTSGENTLTFQGEINKTSLSLRSDSSKGNSYYIIGNIKGSEINGKAKLGTHKVLFFTKRDGSVMDLEMKSFEPEQMILTASLNLAQSELKVDFQDAHKLLWGLKSFSGRFMYGCKNQSAYIMTSFRENDYLLTGNVKDLKKFDLQFKDTMSSEYIINLNLEGDYTNKKWIGKLSIPHIISYNSMQGKLEYDWKEEHLSGNFVFITDDTELFTTSLKFQSSVDRRHSLTVLANSPLFGRIEIDGAKETNGISFNFKNNQGTFHFNVNFVNDVDFPEISGVLKNELTYFPQIHVNTLLKKKENGFQCTFDGKMNNNTVKTSGNLHPKNGRLDFTFHFPYLDIYSDDYQFEYAINTNDLYVSIFETKVKIIDLSIKSSVEKGIEMNIKTPYEAFEDLKATMFYDIDSNNKRLDINLFVKNITTYYLHGLIEDGHFHLKAKLPFDETYELSFQYPTYSRSIAALNIVYNDHIGRMKVELDKSFKKGSTEGELQLPSLNVRDYVFELSYDVRDTMAAKIDVLNYRLLNFASHYEACKTDDCDGKNVGSHQIVLVLGHLLQANIDHKQGNTKLNATSHYFIGRDQIFADLHYNMEYVNKWVDLTITKEDGSVLLKSSVKFTITSDTFDGKLFLTSHSLVKELKMHFKYTISANPVASLKIRIDGKTYKVKSSVTFDDIVPTIHISTTFEGYELIVLRDSYKADGNKVFYDIFIETNGEKMVELSVQYAGPSLWKEGGSLSASLRTPLPGFKENKFEAVWSFSDPYTLTISFLCDSTHQYLLSGIGSLNDMAFQFDLKTPYEGYETLSISGKSGTTSISKVIGLQIQNDRHKRDVGLEYDTNGGNFGFKIPFNHGTSFNLHSTMLRDAERPGVQFKFDSIDVARRIVGLGAKHNFIDPLKQGSIFMRFSVPHWIKHPMELSLNYDEQYIAFNLQATEDYHGSIHGSPHHVIVAGKWNDLYFSHNSTAGGARRDLDTTSHTENNIAGWFVGDPKQVTMTDYYHKYGEELQMNHTITSRSGKITTSKLLMSKTPIQEYSLSYSVNDNDVNQCEIKMNVHWRNDAKDGKIHAVIFNHFRIHGDFNISPTVSDLNLKMDEYFFELTVDDSKREKTIANAKTNIGGLFDGDTQVKTTLEIDYQHYSHLHIKQETRKLHTELVKTVFTLDKEENSRGFVMKVSSNGILKMESSMEYDGDTGKGELLVNDTGTIFKALIEFSSAAYTLSFRENDEILFSSEATWDIDERNQFVCNLSSVISNESPINVKVAASRAGGKFDLQSEDGSLQLKASFDVLKAGLKLDIKEGRDLEESHSYAEINWHDFANQFLLKASINEEDFQIGWNIYENSFQMSLNTDDIDGFIKYEKSKLKVKIADFLQIKGQASFTNGKVIFIGTVDNNLIDAIFVEAKFILHLVKMELKSQFKMKMNGQVTNFKIRGKIQDNIGKFELHTSFPELQILTFVIKENSLRITVQSFDRQYYALSGNKFEDRASFELETPFEGIHKVNFQIHWTPDTFTSSLTAHTQRNDNSFVLKINLSTTESLKCSLEVHGQKFFELSSVWNISKKQCNLKIVVKNYMDFSGAYKSGNLVAQLESPYFGKYVLSGKYFMESNTHTFLGTLQTGFGEHKIEAAYDREKLGHLAISFSGGKSIHMKVEKKGGIWNINGEDNFIFNDLNANCEYEAKFLVCRIQDGTDNHKLTASLHHHDVEIQWDINGGQYINVKAQYQSPTHMYLQARLPYPYISNIDFNVTDARISIRSDLYFVKNELLIDWKHSELFKAKISAESDQYGAFDLRLQRKLNHISAKGTLRFDANNAYHGSIDIELTLDGKMEFALSSEGKMFDISMGQGYPHSSHGHMSPPTPSGAFFSVKNSMGEHTISYNFNEDDKFSIGLVSPYISRQKRDLSISYDNSGDTKVISVKTPLNHLHTIESTISFVSSGEYDFSHLAEKVYLHVSVDITGPTKPIRTEITIDLSAEEGSVMIIWHDHVATWNYESSHLDGKSNIRVKGSWDNKYFEISAIQKISDNRLFLKTVMRNNIETLFTIKEMTDIYDVYYSDNWDRLNLQYTQIEDNATTVSGNFSYHIDADESNIHLGVIKAPKVNDNTTWTLKCDVSWSEGQARGSSLYSYDGNYSTKHAAAIDAHWKFEAEDVTRGKMTGDLDGHSYEIDFEVDTHKYRHATIKISKGHPDAAPSRTLKYEYTAVSNENRFQLNYTADGHANTTFDLTWLQDSHSHYKFQIVIDSDDSQMFLANGEYKNTDGNFLIDFHVPYLRAKIHFSDKVIHLIFVHPLPFADFDILVQHNFEEPDKTLDAFFHLNEILVYKLQSKIYWSANKSNINVAFFDDADIPIFSLKGLRSNFFDEFRYELNVIGHYYSLSQTKIQKSDSSEYVTVLKDDEKTLLSHQFTQGGTKDMKPFYESTIVLYEEKICTAKLSLNNALHENYNVHKIEITSGKSKLNVSFLSEGLHIEAYMKKDLFGIPYSFAFKHVKDEQSMKTLFISDELSIKFKGGSEYDGLHKVNGHMALITPYSDVRELSINMKYNIDSHGFNGGAEIKHNGNALRAKLKIGEETVLILVETPFSFLKQLKLSAKRSSSKWILDVEHNDTLDAKLIVHLYTSFDLSVSSHKNMILQTKGAIDWDEKHATYTFVSPLTSMTSVFKITKLNQKHVEAKLELEYNEEEIELEIKITHQKLLIEVETSFWSLKTVKCSIDATNLQYITAKLEIAEMELSIVVSILGGNITANVKDRDRVLYHFDLLVNLEERKLTAKTQWEDKSLNIAGQISDSNFDLLINTPFSGGESISAKGKWLMNKDNGIDVTGKINFGSQSYSLNMNIKIRPHIVVSGKVTDGSKSAEYSIDLHYTDRKKISASLQTTIQGWESFRIEGEWIPRYSEDEKGGKVHGKVILSANSEYAIEAKFLMFPYYYLDIKVHDAEEEIAHTRWLIDLTKKISFVATTPLYKSLGLDVEWFTAADKISVDGKLTMGEMKYSLDMKVLMDSIHEFSLNVSGGQHTMRYLVRLDWTRNELLVQCHISNSIDVKLKCVLESTYGVTAVLHIKLSETEPIHAEYSHEIGSDVNRILLNISKGTGTYCHLSGVLRLHPDFKLSFILSTAIGSLEFVSQIEQQTLKSSVKIVSTDMEPIELNVQCDYDDINYKCSSKFKGLRLDPIEANFEWRPSDGSLDAVMKLGVKEYVLHTDVLYDDTYKLNFIMELDRNASNGVTLLGGLILNSSFAFDRSIMSLETSVSHFQELTKADFKAGFQDDGLFFIKTRMEIPQDAVLYNIETTINYSLPGKIVVFFNGEIPLLLDSHPLKLDIILKPGLDNIGMTLVLQVHGDKHHMDIQILRSENEIKVICGGAINESPFSLDLHYTTVSGFLELSFNLKVKSLISLALELHPYIYNFEISVPNALEAKIDLNIADGKDIIGNIMVTLEEGVLERFNGTIQFSLTSQGDFQITMDYWDKDHSTRTKRSISLNDQLISLHEYVSDSLQYQVSMQPDLLNGAMIVKSNSNVHTFSYKLDDKTFDIHLNSPYLTGGHVIFKGTIDVANLDFSGNFNCGDLNSHISINFKDLPYYKLKFLFQIKEFRPTCLFESYFNDDVFHLSAKYKDAHSLELDWNSMTSFKIKATSYGYTYGIKSSPSESNRIVIIVTFDTEILTFNTDYERNEEVISGTISLKSTLDSLKEVRCSFLIHNNMEYKFSWILPFPLSGSVEMRVEDGDTYSIKGEFISAFDEIQLMSGQCKLFLANRTVIGSLKTQEDVYQLHGHCNKNIVVLDILGSSGSLAHIEITLVESEFFTSIQSHIMAPVIHPLMLHFDTSISKGIGLAGGKVEVHLQIGETTTYNFKSSYNFGLVSPRHIEISIGDLFAFNLGYANTSDKKMLKVHATIIENSLGTQFEYHFISFEDFVLHGQLDVPMLPSIKMHASNELLDEKRTAVLEFKYSNLHVLAQGHILADGGFQIMTIQNEYKQALDYLYNDKKFLLSIRGSAPPILLRYPVLFVAEHEFNTKNTKFVWMKNSPSNEPDVYLHYSTASKTIMFKLRATTAVRVTWYPGVFHASVGIYEDRFRMAIDFSPDVMSFVIKSGGMFTTLVSYKTIQGGNKLSVTANGNHLLGYEYSNLKIQHLKAFSEHIHVKAKLANYTLMHTSHSHEDAMKYSIHRELEWGGQLETKSVVMEQESGDDYFKLRLRRSKSDEQINVQISRTSRTDVEAELKVHEGHRDIVFAKISTRMRNNPNHLSTDVHGTIKLENNKAKNITAQAFYDKAKRIGHLHLASDNTAYTLLEHAL